ncbi:PTS sugar transporter subunit IIA [Frischella perrara]|jgi:Phosphotransferase system, mannose/fructose-specific component IIA|uniref:PTS mannose transporter subunit IIAB n=1 Tax=Frischella perrara TaxID=1267021 RepID=A0A0A7S104_FRIPE|nr:PTS sugar transporter subunit IIA [Frischella perrara]AJA44517.1 Phosphotransferase system, mannose/fructose-specific component IIA [Frischella perrara]PWV65161.1 PTS system mannose-specific IIA component [Frischella perrara]PXY95933.1 PTS mannose transporter subunit IIAB [Frischella perrara]
MSKQLPIILASHGPFAQGALECAQMLMGKQDNIEVISVLVDSNIDVLRSQMQQSYHKLNDGNGVIILVDLMGGTPCNLAGELVIQHSDVLLFCGFNIPVLLEVLNNREGNLAEVKEVIEQSFAPSCFDVSQILTAQCEQTTEL